MITTREPPPPPTPPKKKKFFTLYFGFKAIISILLFSARIFTLLACMAIGKDTSADIISLECPNPFLPNRCILAGVLKRPFTGARNLIKNIHTILESSLVNVSLKILRCFQFLFNLQNFLMISLFRIS